MSSHHLDAQGIAGLHCLGRLLDVLSHIRSQNRSFDEVQIRPTGDRLILWKSGHWVAEMRVSFPKGNIRIGLITSQGSQHRRQGGLEVLIEHFGVSADWRHPIASDITRLTCLAAGQSDPMFPRLLFTNIRFLFEHELLIVNAGYGEIGFQSIGNGRLRYGKCDESPQTMHMSEWNDWIRATFS